MKRFLLGTVGLAALSLSAPASAADLAAHPYVKAPPPPAPIAAVYDWTGFYIGINGGGGSAHKCWDFVDPVTGALNSNGCHDATGGTIGGQIGYRWQAANWVFGVEGQGNWADFSGDNIFNGVDAVTGLPISNRDRSRVDAFGLITGQVGYAWNNVLLYVKGGAAVVGDKYDAFDAPTGVLLASASETRWGATVGAGLEFGFAPNWSVGFEYDHIFLGHRDIDFTDTTGAFAVTERIGQDVDIGLIRLNYRFGGYGAPIAARY